MDIGKAFSYPFEDPDWLQKLGIAALVMLIPLVGQIILMGWGLEVTRRVIRKEEQPLPDWSDFGGYLVRGLQVWVIGLVYALPIILVTACSQGLIFGFADTNDDTVASIIAIVSICLSCVVILYSLALAFFVPAAIGKFAETEQLGSAFRFGEVFSLVRAAPAAYLLVLLGTLIAGFIGSLGVIVCVVGVLLTSAYAAAITGHLQGQAYLQAAAALEAQPDLAGV